MLYDSHLDVFKGKRNRVCKYLVMVSKPGL